MDAGTIFAILFCSAVVSGIICAVIADARGVNPGGWFFIGFLLNGMAIPFAAIALPYQANLEKKGIENGTHKKCPECAEVVKAEAVKCRYCHSTLEVEEQQDLEVEEQQETEPDRSQNEKQTEN